MAEVAGWTSPAYTAMQQMPQMWGVPLEIGFFLLLSGLFLLLVWWPMAVLIGVAYCVCRVGTLYEPNWVWIFIDRFSYWWGGAHYEG